MNAQARSVGIPKRWPLVNVLQTRSSSVPLTKDARLVNCYAELDAQEQTYWIYKRMGLSTDPIVSTASPYLIGYGIYVHPGTGTMFFVQKNNSGTDAKLYLRKAAGGTPTLVGTVDGSAPYFFETVNSSPQDIVLGNGTTAYYVSSGGSSATLISGGGFPAVFVQGWAYLDGTLYVMDPTGNIFGSDINNPASWNALNVIPASSNADLGVALIKQLSYIVAFKQYTTQIFYDAEQPPPGSPLLPVPDAQIPLGCCSAVSVQAIDNSILWMTSNQTASPQIVQMDNLTPTIISTPAVDRILDDATWQDFQIITRGWPFPGYTVVAPAGIYSWAIKHGGHRFYGLSLTNYDITLVYDLDQKLWYVWQDYQNNFWPVVGFGYNPTGFGTPGLHYAQHASNGNIYKMDAAYVYPNDFGNVFPVDIYTPNFDAGTNRRKQLKTMYFTADKVNATLQARYTDDDFNNWSNFRPVDLSSKKPRLTDCGTFYQRRAYHFRHQANTPFRIRSVDLQMDVGTL